MLAVSAAITSQLAAFPDMSAGRIGPHPSAITKPQEDEGGVRSRVPELVPEWAAAEAAEAQAMGEALEPSADAAAAEALQPSVKWGKAAAKSGKVVPLVKAVGHMTVLGRATKAMMPTKTKKQRNQSFLTRHGDDKAAEMRQRVSQISQQLKERDRSKRFVVVPSKVKGIWMWDVTTTVALLYTAVITPFEASFLEPTVGPISWTDGWFLANRLLDMIFFLDMLLQFVLAYEKADARKGTLWVEDRQQITRNYLTTWFPLDASTIVVPCGFDLYLAHGFDNPNTADQGGGLQTGSAGVLENFTILRVLRVIRLVKLVRLVRASRVFKRWKAKIVLSYSTQTVLECVITLVMAAHWYACIIALQASLHSAPDRTWLGPGAYGYCVPAVLKQGTDQALDALDHSVPVCGDVHIGKLYLASFSWSTMVITGTGGTDFYPSNNSDPETIVVTMLVVVGALLWTRVLAMFCEVATNGDPGFTYFRQSLDGLNHFIDTNGVPAEMARRLREYVHQQKDVNLREASASKALPLLSPALQIEVVLHCHRHWLEAVWFLRETEETAMVRLAMSMKSRTLAPQEVAPNRHLYVIARGLALYGGRVLSAGMAWGDDVILLHEKYFLPYLARAMSFLDLYALSRETLLTVLSNFPISARRLRRAQILLALRREVIELAKSFRMANHPGRRLVDPRDDPANLDLIDRVDHAAASLSKTQGKSVNMAVTLEKQMALANSTRSLPIGFVSNAATTQGPATSTNPGEGNAGEAGLAALGLTVESMRHEQATLQSNFRDLQKAMRADVGGLHSAIDKLTALVEAQSLAKGGEK